MKNQLFLAFAAALCSVSVSFSIQAPFPTTFRSPTKLYIIGGAIRKWKEEQSKKNLPMASPDEIAVESTGLRVNNDAWKWPPVWPYESDLFLRKNEEVGNINPLSLLDKEKVSLALVQRKKCVGLQQHTNPYVIQAISDMETKSTELIANSGNLTKEFWSSPTKTTGIDDGAISKLKSHYEFYMKDTPSPSILELGAAENSYLPDTISERAKRASLGEYEHTYSR